MGLTALLSGCSGDGATAARNGPWRERTPVGAAGEALAVLADGTILVASGAGFRASDDGGETWTSVPTEGLPTGSVISMTTAGESVVAYVWGRGLYGSDDGGRSWTPLGELALDPLLSLATSTRAAMVP